MTPMGRLRSLSIRRKITLATVLASVSALLVTALGVLAYEATTFRPKAREESRTHIELLSPTLAAALRFHDPEAAGEDLRILAVDSSICSAVLFDEEGARFATFDTGRHPQHLPEALPPAGERFVPRRLETVAGIVENERILGTLVVERDLPPLVLRLPQYGLMLLGVCFALLSASAMLMIGMRRTITGPVLALADAAEAVRDRGDYSVRVPTRSADEIGRLTEAFNAMLETIQNRERDLAEAYRSQRDLQKSLDEAARLESVGRLAGGIAHDFNNLLTIVAGSTDLALRQSDRSSEVHRLLNNVRNATTQAAELTKRLLAFSRAQPLRLAPVDLRRLVLDSVGMMKSLLGAQIELTVSHGAHPCWVRSDPHQLSQVVINLVLNARDAMPNGGHLEIAVAPAQEHPPELLAEDSAHSGFFVLMVSDDGVGMTEETRRHVFEPFFTTKKVGRGTGLGLASSYGIVQGSGGVIQVDSIFGQGTTFTVWLPKVSPDLSSAISPSSEQLGRFGSLSGRTILLVEDEAAVRTVAATTLEEEGLVVLAAENGEDALVLMRRHREKIDLLVTDVVMPGMNGRDLAHRIQEIVPGLPVLFASAHSDEQLPTGADWASFLQKPFGRTELLAAVRQSLALGSRAGEASNAEHDSESLPP